MAAKRNARELRIGYVRVSTLDQNTERQLEGVPLDKTFTDKASGKDTHRPQLQAALAFVREGDTLVVHSMDRLCRNSEDMLRLVRELTGAGIAVEFTKERLVFRGGHDASPMDTLMLTLLSAFAAFERSLIRERQREGIAIAKGKGAYKGRKPSLSPEQGAVLRERVKAGHPKATIARELGVSRETLYKYLRAVRDPAGRA